MPPTARDVVELALRDQLVAALRTAGSPITTGNLALLMPRHRHLHHGGWNSPPLCARDHVLLEASPYVELVECRGPHEHVLLMHTMPMRIYPILQQLQRESRCRRAGRIPYGPASMWEWVPPLQAPDTRRDEIQLDDQFAEIAARLDLDGES